MRYFIEISYKGTNYSGFQIQHNANTVQAEVEKALHIFFKGKINLTGSSRTDAGVHALKNYFHFDFVNEIDPSVSYNLNSILPGDIVINNIRKVNDTAHCRFDAVYREYKYYIYQKKNPFLADRAYYFPYKLDYALLQEAASIIKNYQDFTSFSKRNTQVKTFKCEIADSKWVNEKDFLIFNIKANRFLRGMVRALAATMLNVGRGKLNTKEFISIIESRNCTNASFAIPPHGLFLVNVNYGENYF